MEYQVETIYEQADLMALSRAVIYQNVSRKKALKSLHSLSRVLREVSRVLSWIIGGFLILVGAVGLWHSVSGLITGADFGSYQMLPLLSVSFPLFGLAIIWRSNDNHTLIGKLEGKLAWKNYGEKGAKILWFFYPECFTVTMPNSDYRHDYPVIKSICQDKERYFLFSAPNAAYIIKKSDFNAGDPAQFGLFIAERTQLPISTVSK